MVKSGKLTEVQAREVCQVARFKSSHSHYPIAQRHLLDRSRSRRRLGTICRTSRQYSRAYVCGSGRPRATLTLTSHSTPIPTVDEQLDALVWTPDTVTDRDVQLKSQPTYISSAFVETVKLMEIGAKIMNTL